MYNVIIKSCNWKLQKCFLLTFIKFEELTQYFQVKDHFLRELYHKYDDIIQMIERDY